MTTIFDRILRRIDATGMSHRSASLKGGLSADALNKLLKRPDQSPTLETVRKLALGLQTTPEWLAYGIGTGTEEETRGKRVAGITKAPAINSGSSPSPPDKRQSHDTSYIQVAVDVLRRYVSGALQNEGIPEEQADAYADVVLELIKGRSTAQIVLRLEDKHHNASGFQGLGFDDQS